VNVIDWMDIPLENFISAIRTEADGTTFLEWYPFGDGEAQRLLVGLSAHVEKAYSGLLSEDDWERAETEGEVPLIREGRRTHKALDRLTLRDLPGILDTLVALEEDHRRPSARPLSARRERECEPESVANSRTWANGSSA